jgi:hypothetical protein
MIAFPESSYGGMLKTIVRPIQCLNKNCRRHVSGVYVLLNVLQRQIEGQWWEHVNEPLISIKGGEFLD